MASLTQSSFIPQKAVEANNVSNPVRYFLYVLAVSFLAQEKAWYAWYIFVLKMVVMKNMIEQISRICFQCPLVFLRIFRKSDGHY